MEYIIPVIWAIILLGYLVKRLLKEDDAVDRAKNTMRNYDKNINAMYEAAHKDAEEINRQVNEVMRKK